MTIIDSEDLRARGCQLCGAVMADRDRHYAWHHRLLAQFDAVLAALADPPPSKEDSTCPSPSAPSSPRATRTGSPT